jgi:hypothetical protein
LHDRIATLSGTEQLSAGLDAAELPPIVTRGVAHYRAEAFRRLSPAAFARVDAVYRHGFDAACAWLRTQVVLRTLATVDPAGLERVHAFLTGLVHDSSTRRHTLTRLRGAQAGFLAHGVLLTIPNTEDLLTVAERAWAEQRAGHYPDHRPDPRWPVGVVAGGDVGLVDDRVDGDGCAVGWGSVAVG